MVLILSANSLAAAPADDAKAVKKAVLVHFAQIEGHLPGDLIRQSDFDQITAAIGKKGVEVKRFAPLREWIPAQSSQIGRLNSTKQGKQFLRKVCNIPGGYVQVEEILEQPGGRSVVGDLMDARGGDQLVRYMATTPGGRRLSAMTTRRAPNPRPKAPRIYTAGDLVEAMLAVIAQPKDSSGPSPR